MNRFSALMVVLGFHLMTSGCAPVSAILGYTESSEESTQTTTGMTTSDDLTAPETAEAKSDRESRENFERMFVSGKKQWELKNVVATYELVDFSGLERNEKWSKPCSAQGHAHLFGKYPDVSVTVPSFSCEGVTTYYYMRNLELIVDYMSYKAEYLAPYLSIDEQFRLDLQSIGTFGSLLFNNKISSGSYTNRAAAVFNFIGDERPKYNGGGIKPVNTLRLSFQTLPDQSEQLSIDYGKTYNSVDIRIKVTANLLRIP